MSKTSLKDWASKAALKLLSASREKPLSPDPIKQFRLWFDQASHTRRIKKPDAMCLSTLNAAGRPTARMVLLKGVDTHGFRFFTNGESPKARDLDAHPHAALTFHWEALDRQVRIEGTVSRLPKETADAYFATRPRLSQIGSWASRQSEPLESRKVFLERVRELLELYQGQQVPAPPHWQGYILHPARMEFWQAFANRLHDRWQYVLEKDGRWSLTRLYP
jgi:pyridoxamine 5'-phosphate oxidase